MRRNINTPAQDKIAAPFPCPGKDAAIYAGGYQSLLSSALLTWIKVVLITSTYIIMYFLSP